MSKVLQKYQKVKVLAERGATEGERTAAREAMKRMEANHPELISPPRPESHRVTYVAIYHNGNWYAGGDFTTSVNSTSTFGAFF